MIELHFFLSFLKIIWPFIILIAFLCVFQIWKERYWDSGLFQEKVKQYLLRYYKKHVSYETYTRVVQYFSEEKSIILIRRGNLVQPCRFAVRPVSYDIFRDFIISGKATLHTLDGTCISDAVQIESKKDLECAIIGICQTQHSGLIFYPSTKSDYRKVVIFLKKRVREIKKEQSLALEIQRLEKKQNYSTENNLRMQMFIQEFAQENTEPEESVSLDLETPADSFPSPSLDIPKPELKI